MTEEEKKKQEQQATATQQPDAVEQSIKSLEDQAAKNREFANSPVKIDTSGQTDWMAKLEQVRREYIESPEQKAAREQREKRNRRIAAISDGLVAMSNIAGAMAGATPIKPSTTMSAAHAKAVEDAAKRRRENADRYAIYSRYLSGLQQKQDKDNADRYDKAVKARQDADKQADNLIGTAARLRQNRENAQRTHELAKQRAEEQKRHNQVTEGQGAQRVTIAKQNADKKGRGGGSSQEDWDEYARWEQLHPDEVNKIKTDNAQINPYTGMPEKSVTSSTVKLVNAKMRQKYGSPESGSKKKVSGFGNSKPSGKKKIAGFGN